MEKIQTIQVFEDGRKYETTYTKKYENRRPWVRPNPEEIKSFIPGTVEKILVKAGNTVKAGDEVMIYTAMKMHNIIRAPFDGKVESIPVKEGDRLPNGAIMMVIKQAQPPVAKIKKKKK